MVSAFYDDGHSAVTPEEKPEKNSRPERLTRRQQDVLLTWVQSWYDAGCAVHPAKIDGSKYAIAVRHGSPDIQPDTFPDTYKSGAPHPRAGQPNPEAGQYGWGWGRIATGAMPRLTPAEVADYVRRGRADGIGVICGLASGGLMMLEAEGRARELLPKDREAAIQLGSLDLLERLSGCADESPSGGIHFYLRVIGCPTPPNVVLAARPNPDVPHGQEVLFETRGQGGWSVVAPSAGRTHNSGKPYRFLRGGPATIPDFTSEELERLYAVFRAVDERPTPEPSLPQTGEIRRRERPSGDILPGDDFDQRASWEEILPGWKKQQSAGDRIHWTRPGKNHGTSATTTDGVLYVFSTSSGLPSGKGLTKFATYAHLHHGGDFSAAARELWNQGYGSRADQVDLPDDIQISPRPEPAGECRSLDDWRQEVAARRAAAITQPGWHLDRSPTGSGKTHATITALRQASSSLTVLPTHANVVERVEEMRAQGIDAVAYPKLTTDNCQNYAKASEAQSLGLVAGAAVCPGCKFKDECDYRGAVKAASQADHRVATHERLRRSSTPAKGVAVVIVDETPEKVVAPSLELPAKQVMAVRHLAHGIAHHWCSEADNDQKAFARTLIGVIDTINAVCEEITEPGTKTVDLGNLARQVPKNWQRLLYDAIGQVGVSRDLTPEALTLVTKAAVGDLQSLEVVTDLVEKGEKQHLHHYLVGTWRPGLPAGVPVILLDATGCAADIEAATGMVVNDCTPSGHLPTVGEVVQLVDDITRRTSPTTVAGVLEAFLEAHPEVQRLGVMGHKPHIAALFEDEKLSPAARGRVTKWCHFGQGPDRGSNDWHQNCDHILILGTPRANPGTYRRWLAQHGLKDAAARDGAWGSKPWRSVTTDGQPTVVAGAGYSDPDWHRAYVAVARAGLHQAVGRGRTILAGGCPVTIVSNEPTPYPVGPSLEASPAALRATVEAVRGLLAPAPRPVLSPIENPYRKKYGSDLVTTAEVVAAVQAATQADGKPSGVCRSAVEKRLRQCRDAGRLIQPRRGLWGLPAGQPEPVQAAAPAVVLPLRPATVVVAVPPEPAPDAVQVVIATPLPDVVTETTTAAPLETPPLDFEGLLEAVDERAAILEYDGGHDRSTADRLAREAILGRDGVTCDPGGAAVEVAAGVDHAALHARTRPLVDDALKRFPATVRVLDDRTDPFAGRRQVVPKAGACKCGHDAWVEVPIHGGKSCRVDCGHCDRFGWYGRWYGQRMEGTTNRPASAPAPEPPAETRSLSFTWLPTTHALPTGPLGVP